MSSEFVERMAKPSIRRRVLTMPLLVVLLALMVGANLGQPDVRFWLLLAAALVGLAVFTQYRAAVFLILLSVFLLTWLSEAVGLLPRQATWLPELALVALTLRVAFELLRNREVKIGPADVAIACLLLVGIVSSFLNSEKAVVLVVGLRNYFKFLPLFYAVRWLDFDEDFLKLMLGALTAIALVQVPVAVVQRVLFVGADSGDIIGGTLGANTSGTLTLFLACIVSLALGAYLNGLLDTKALLALVALLFAPMVINETKITFILFPLVALFLLSRRSGFVSGLRRAVVPLFACAVLLGVGLLAYNALYPGFYSRERDVLAGGRLDYITSERTKSGSLNRIAQLGFADENIRKDIQTAAVGVGPGNASESFFANGTGAYYNKYPRLKIDSLFSGRTLWEYGYVGSSLFAFVFAYLWIAAAVVARGEKDPLRRSVALGFQGIMLVMLVSAFYSGSVLIPALGFVFWFFAGYVQRWRLEQTGDETTEVGR